jgi:hypothetical protein
VTHNHPVIKPVQRVCICPSPRPDKPHTLLCNRRHRDTFMAAWRDVRARFYGSER